MINLKLFLEFFKIGLFAIGGGLVTIPFLYDLAYKTTWFDPSLIPDMIAISESTPGPLGVNMATYTGFSVGGVISGIIATLGLVTPSIIIILIVSKFLEKFKQNKTVKNVFYGLRASVIGLIASIGIDILGETLLLPNSFTLKLKESLLFLIILILMQKNKVHPVSFILISGLAGIILKL